MKKALTFISLLVSVVVTSKLHATWKDGQIDHNFSCPGQGLYSYPNDSQFYYNCWNGVAYVQRCPQGLHFDSDTKNCDYEDKTHPDDRWKLACGSRQPLVLTNTGHIKMKHSSHQPHSGNVSCSWIIIAPPYHKIMLKITEFNLENSRNCSSDSLSVHDGTCEADAHLASLCGRRDTISTSIVSSKNKLRLFFRMNADEEDDKGFNIKYEFLDEKDVPTLPPPVIADESVACGADRPLKLTSARGIISSPNFDFGNSTYPSNSDCGWSLEAPSDHFIRIEFVFFQLQSSISCGLDALVVYGLPDQSEFLGAFCGFDVPPDFTKARNRLYLRFVSDGLKNYDGFQLVYYFTKQKQKQCKSNEMKCSVSGKCVSNVKRCDGFEDCEDGSDENLCYYPVNERVPCGSPVFPPVPGNARIVGGKIARPGNWPWQATLFANGEFQCGGAVIDENWILTAAHCFKRNSNPSSWKIAVGKQHLNAEDETEQRRVVDKIVVHPLYNPNPSSDPMKIHRDNDIALMKLKTRVFFTEYVRPVCFPVGSEPRPGMDNFTGYVTGFGDTRDFLTYGVLKQAELVVYDRERCRDSYPGIIAGSMFCASWPTGGNDACQGDSGGPFVHQHDGFWHLLGVISWGNNCGNPRQPGVYTEVSCYVRWIEEVARLSRFRSV